MELGSDAQRHSQHEEINRESGKANEYTGSKESGKWQKHDNY